MVNAIYLGFWIKETNVYFSLCSDFLWTKIKSINREIIISRFVKKNYCYFNNKEVIVIFCFHSCNGVDTVTVPLFVVLF